MLLFVKFCSVVKICWSQLKLSDGESKENNFSQIKAHMVTCILVGYVLAKSIQNHSKHDSISPCKTVQQVFHKACRHELCMRIRQIPWSTFCFRKQGAALECSYTREGGRHRSKALKIKHLHARLSVSKFKHFVAFPCSKSAVVVLLSILSPSTVGEQSYHDKQTGQHLKQNLYLNKVLALHLKNY